MATPIAAVETKLTKARQIKRGMTQAETPVKILQLLGTNPRMTLAEVAATIGKSVSAVERAGSRLVEEGRLQYIGPAKGGIGK